MIMESNFGFKYLYLFYIVVFVSFLLLSLYISKYGYDSDLILTIKVSFVFLLLASIVGNTVKRSKKYIERKWMTVLIISTCGYLFSSLLLLVFK